MSGRCEWCGEPFDMTQPHRRFCCSAHRDKASQARRAQQAECVCRQCGEHFSTSREAVSRGRGKFCTKHCAVVWGNAHREKTPQSTAIKYAECIECGALFVKRRGKKCCPRHDGDRRLAGRRWLRNQGRDMAEGQPPGVYECEECGKSFTTSRWHGTPKRFCCTRHAAAEANRLYQHQRRALARQDNAATPAEVRAKRTAAGGRCHWCGKKSKRLTIDHVVPVSRGGTNEIGNLVFACSDCNCKSKRELMPNVEWNPEDKHGQAMLCLV